MKLILALIILLMSIAHLTSAMALPFSIRDIISFNKVVARAVGSDAAAEAGQKSGFAGILEMCTGKSLTGTCEQAFYDHNKCYYLVGMSAIKSAVTLDIGASWDNDNGAASQCTLYSGDGGCAADLSVIVPWTGVEDISFADWSGFKCT